MSNVSEQAKQLIADEASKIVDSKMSKYEEVITKSVESNLQNISLNRSFLYKIKRVAISLNIFNKISFSCIID